MACRPAHYAWSDHFVIGIPLRSLLPMVALISVPTIGRTRRSRYTYHEGRPTRSGPARQRYPFNDLPSPDRIIVINESPRLLS